MAKSFSRLPPLPALRDFIHMYQIRARKILSQNFLMDLNITRKIVKQAGIKSEDHVIEVGPGPGGITRSLLETGCKRLDVIEIDRRFMPALEECFVNCHTDVLKLDMGDIWNKCAVEPHLWHEDPPPLHIIGNLPFNVSTPLIIKLLNQMSERGGPWSFGRVKATLTFQLEVGKRLCSVIDSEERSRISVMAEYLTHRKILFTISGSCFVPKPKVDAAVVQFVPRVEPLIKSSFKVILKTCRHLFHYRQKYVIRCIKTLYPEPLANSLAHEVLSRCRIDPTIPCYKLGVEQISDICRIYEEQCYRYTIIFFSLSVVATYLTYKFSFLSNLKNPSCKHSHLLLMPAAYHSYFAATVIELMAKLRLR
ncbi:unnamed protein product [Enterobius vermicularis]|uniref:rRNA adenine N(6)-methyltransferase n=1 Tax=Enterobius vermicularis TaxID=51028 RepID=A0A0N4VFL8_ENTVE|nr:unnamed protein product [Enterobius vermicularis]